MQSSAARNGLLVVLQDGFFERRLTAELLREINIVATPGALPASALQALALPRLHLEVPVLHWLVCWRQPPWSKLCLHRTHGEAASPGTTYCSEPPATSV